MDDLRYERVSKCESLTRIGAIRPGYFSNGNRDLDSFSVPLALLQRRAKARDIRRLY